MNNKTMTIKEARRALKNLGYKLQTKVNPFNPDIKCLYFSGRGIDKPFLFGNVMTTEFYAKHKHALVILNNTDRRS